jgi:hypothetical protein
VAGCRSDDGVFGFCWGVHLGKNLGWEGLWDSWVKSITESR